MKDDRQDIKQNKNIDSGAARNEADGPKEGTDKPDAAEALRRELHHLTKKELEEKVLELVGKLTEEKARSREYLDDAQRQKAELENYRKRMIREQSRIIDQANRGLMLKLLPVIDNLEKALDSEQASDSPLARGVRMVYEQFMEALAQEGLEVIDPQGHHFDPEVCEAVMAVISDDHEDETVVEVHQKGYKYKGNLLRPARATVSKCG